MPGRPPVAPYLHGIAQWDSPRTSVAWRDEVPFITKDLIERNVKEFPQSLLEDYLLKPHELLNDLSERVYTVLQHMQKRLKKSCKTSSIWIIDQQGEVTRRNLDKWLEGDKKREIRQISGCTLLFPPLVGGLTSQGTLDGKASHDENHPSGYDIADLWMDHENQQRRRRIFSAESEPPKRFENMALIRTNDTDPDVEEFALPAEETELSGAASTNGKRFWHWYARPFAAEDATSCTKDPCNVKRSRTRRHQKALRASSTP